MRPENRVHPDLFPALCWLAGGILVGLIALAAATIAIPELLSPGHLIAVARETQVLDAIMITFCAGFVAVLILVVLGTPLAYLLARGSWWWKSIVETVVDLPLALPHTVAGLMIYLLFMIRGPIGMPFSELGIFFEDAFPGIIAAMVFVSIPYYVDTVREGICRVPEHLESVARSLGASRFRAVMTITLPLSSRSILSGAFLAWGRAIGEFAAVVMIAYFPVVVSTLIYQQFTTGGLEESRSIAFIMLAACLLVFIVFRLVSHGWGRQIDRT